MMRWRMSGLRIGGSGSEMSSKAMVSFMPGFISADNGSESPRGASRASRMARSGSTSPSRGSAGYTIRLRPAGSFSIRKPSP
jgi:hypothetical protein